MSISFGSMFHVEPRRQIHSVLLFSDFFFLTADVLMRHPQLSKRWRQKFPFKIDFFSRVKMVHEAEHRAESTALPGNPPQAAVAPC